MKTLKTNEHSLLFYADCGFKFMSYAYAYINILIFFVFEIKA